MVLQPENVTNIFHEKAPFKLNHGKRSFNLVFLFQLIEI